MDLTSLQDFYTYAVLPQFGIKGMVINWQDEQDTGPDETAYYFRINDQEYALLFEDHDGLGRDAEYIKENILDHPRAYEFVVPTSETGNSPSYGGFHLPVPSVYCRNVTGTFTLLKLL